MKKYIIIAMMFLGGITFLSAGHSHGCCPKKACEVKKVEPKPCKKVCKPRDPCDRSVGEKVARTIIPIFWFMDDECCPKPKCVKKKPVCKPRCDAAPKCHVHKHAVGCDGDDHIDDEKAPEDILMEEMIDDSDIYR